MYLVLQEKKKRLEKCLIEYRSFYYQRYFDDIFVLFNSPEHLKHIYTNICIPKGKKDNRTSILSVERILEKGRLTISVYQKSHISRIYIQL